MTLQCRDKKDGKVYVSKGSINVYGNIELLGTNGVSAGHYKIDEVEVYIPGVEEWVDIALGLSMGLLLPVNGIEIELNHCLRKYACH